MGIKYAIRVALEAREALDSIDTFGRNKFMEEFPLDKRNGPVWYIKTTVIDSARLEVHYGYGEDFENSFKVSIYGTEND